MSVQMILGFFPFMLSTAAYEELTRSTSYEWAEQKRVGQLPALHFTGPNTPTHSFKGKLCPPFTGNRSNLQALRLMAEQGLPLVLISGTGVVFGRWVITEIQDTGTHHMDNGVPRHTEFTIAIKKYDNGVGALLQALTKISSIASALV